MIRLAAVVPVAALLSLGAGCSSVPVGSAPATRAHEAPRVGDPGYAEALDRATRHESVYDGLERRVYGAATLQSVAFRAARVHAVSRFLHLSDAETRVRLESERLEAGRFVDFFVGLSTAERRWNDLDRPGSIWRVELEAGGATFLPLSVQRIERPDANTVALYPYLTPFWVAYRIRFPLLDPAGAPLFPADGPLLLRLSSSVGRLEFRFDGDGEAARAR